jgi:DNA-binding Xre family transcriptional regulator
VIELFEQLVGSGFASAALRSGVGMMRSNMSCIEAVKHRATLETIKRIATTLKVPVADLIVRC